mgnify:CR=1 FL=1
MKASGPVCGYFPVKVGQIVVWMLVIFFGNYSEVPKNLFDPETEILPAEVLTGYPPIGT